MFTRWLLNILPGELAAGWRIVRADLALWLAVALVPALLTAASMRQSAMPDADAAAPGRSALVALSLLAPILASLFLTIVAIVKFDAAASGRSIALDEALRRAAKRTLAYFVTLLCITLVTGLPTVLIWAAVRGLTQGTPVGALAPPAVGTAVYVSLLARYGFWQYLVVLDRRTRLTGAAVGEGTWLDRIGIIGWPLMASSTMTEGFRWRLVPYVALLAAGPMLTAVPSESMRAPLAAVWWVVQLTLQAILFEHYRRRHEIVASERLPRQPREVSQPSA